MKVTLTIKKGAQSYHVTDVIIESEFDGMWADTLDELVDVINKTSKAELLLNLYQGE